MDDADPNRKKQDQDRKKGVMKTLAEAIGINTANDAKSDIEKDLLPRPLQINKRAKNAEDQDSIIGQAGQEHGQEAMDERKGRQPDQRTCIAKDYDFVRRLTHKLARVQWERERERMREGGSEAGGGEDARALEGERG